MTQTGQQVDDEASSPRNQFERENRSFRAEECSERSAVDVSQPQCSSSNGRAARQDFKVRKEGRGPRSKGQVWAGCTTTTRGAD